MVDVVAVLPSYRPDPDALATLCGRLDSAGVSPVVITTGIVAQKAAISHKLRYLDPRANRGFGPSIDWAVEQLGEWDWLLLCNDDVTVDDPGAVAGAIAALPPAADAVILHLDEEPPRRVPGLLDVFTNVSLLARVGDRVRLPSRSGRLTYRSFSCVLISRTAWNLVGGFDGRLPFTYEDADFVRRLHRAGGRALDVRVAGVRHARSVTTSRNVDTVLPVATWSALAYADKWYPRPAALAKSIVLIALLVRVFTAPAGRAPLGAHLRGISRAALAVVSSRRPELAAYESSH